MLRLFRYRFFVFATPIPYFIGAASAYQSYKDFHSISFLIGLLGIIFSSGAVETFNEYFDPSDSTVQELRGLHHPSRRIFYLGISLFFAAFLIGLYLSWSRGLWVLLFAALGFFTAAFYVGPPIRLAYRGLGEVAIFFTYGPLLALGSYYLQAQRVDLTPVLISLIPGSLIFALYILNALPDYYWDKISGKNNLVVLLGRKRASFLYGTVFLSTYVLQIMLVVAKALPPWTLLTLFTLPLAWRAIRLVQHNYQNPGALLPAVNTTIFFFLGVNIFFILGLIAWSGAG